MDYSRFDHIETDSDDELETPGSPAPGSGTAAAPPAAARMTAKGRDGRLKFEFEGRTIYEWEQSLEEVFMHNVL